MNPDGRTVSEDLEDALQGLSACMAEVKAIYHGISGADAVKEASDGIQGDKKKAEAIPTNLVDRAAVIAGEIGQIHQWLLAIRVDLGLASPDPVAFEE